MNNLRGAKIIYQESKATQPSHLYFLQKDENYCEVIVTSESGVKRKLNINVDLSNFYTKNETYSKIEINELLDVIEVTKTELDVLISENKLEPNRLYKITGIESWCFSQHLIKAIYLKAITNNTLESEGLGEFYTPKYNELDSNLGIWKGELFTNGMIDSLSYNIGDKVIWGNLFWENISGEIGNNIKRLGDSEDIVLNNYLSEIDWHLITPNDDESLYNINFNIIKYDLINDYIYYREDDLGNKYELSYNFLIDIFPDSSIINLFPEFIYDVNSIALFQWGRNNTSNNIINESIVLNCNYNTLYFKDNVILDKTIIERNNFLGISFIGNKLKTSLITSNFLKTYGNILYNSLENSEILSNGYYIEISYNVLNYNSEISNNNDYGIILNDKYSKITTNNLYNNSEISGNVFVEEGKEIDGTIKSIYGNELINNCSINSNVIKNGSTIFGHKLEYFSSINENILDTEANIYNNQLIQNGKIHNNILTGHGRIFGNQLDRLSKITNCKLRISPATSYASGIHTNKLFTGKIQNIDFGNIVNPEGTNPNDPNFGGNELSGCIVENSSIIKDLIFPNTGGKYIQFVKMNGFSEFKNITVNDSIRNVDFINTIFNETSDYSKLIEGSGLQTDGFTKTYIDGVLLQDRFNEKQANLGYTPEDVINKSDSYTASSSTTYASTKALVDGLATKLNKPTTTGNTTNFPYVVGEDGNGNPARLPAGDLGKNFFNSDLSNTSARNHTMNAGVTVNTLGNPHTLSGLPNKNADITNFRKVRVQNTSGLDSVVDSKNMLLDMPSYLTEQERTDWKTAMNGGWTTNTMSIGFISPLTVKRENFNTFFSLKGTNLNLNPTSFKVEIMDETGVNVLAEVPNYQVTLYTNGIDLSFYYNIFSLGLGKFKIRIWNGVATYTSGLYFLIAESVEYIDLSANVFNFITFNGVVNDNSSKSNISVSYKADADVKPLANNGDLPVLSALSNQIATMQDNFYLEFNFTVSGGDFGNNNINRVGICNNSTNSLSNDIIAGLVQQTSTNHSDINSGGTVISNINTTTKMVIIKQNNIISTYLANSTNTTFKSSVISTFINNNPVKIKGLFSNTTNTLASVSFSIVNAYKF